MNLARLGGCHVRDRFWYCAVVVSYSLTNNRFCSLIIHFMISLMYSRRMLRDSGSMLVYAMNGPKLTTYQWCSRPIRRTKETE